MLSAKLGPSYEEISANRAREAQKGFMNEIIIPYVQKRNYLDVYKPESFSDRFYSVSGMSIFREWEPRVFLIRYKNKKNSQDDFDSNNKSNKMSISLHGRERTSCYVKSGGISVYITPNKGGHKMEDMDVMFELKPHGMKSRGRDSWAGEKEFVGHWLSYFDEMPL